MSGARHVSARSIVITFTYSCRLGHRAESTEDCTARAHLGMRAAQLN
jgi:hypothetical protein